MPSPPLNSSLVCDCNRTVTVTSPGVCEMEKVSSSKSGISGTMTVQGKT